MSNDERPIEDEWPVWPIESRPRPRWSLILGIPLLLLSGLGIWLGPRLIWCLRATAEYDRLGDEVRKIGGTAYLPEGGIDLQNRTLDGGVDLSGTAIDDDGLAQIVTMPGFQWVKSIGLAGTSVTNRGIEVLRGNHRLIGINLSRTKITDKGLGILLTNPWLSYLNLSGTAVSRDGLETLRERHSSDHHLQLDVTDTAVNEEEVWEFILGCSFRVSVRYGPSKEPKTLNREEVLSAAAKGKVRSTQSLDWPDTPDKR